MPPPVEGDAEHYFIDEAARLAAEEIASAGGVEVFFIGRRGDHGLIQEMESHAYGNPGTVPALIHLLRPGEIFIHNHPNGNLMPSDADLNVASVVGNMGVGCYIINNDCSRVRCVVRPHDAKKKVSIDGAEVLRKLSPRSALSKVIDEFEDRPQQRTMAGAVTDAFNNDGIAIIEAGTGTGKSLAYLMPSVFFALKNNERVIISTNTINLQEQLLHKDLPAIRRAMDSELRVEIVKGRGNYVCKRKASYASAEADSLLEDDFVLELKQVLEWAKTSDTGDRHDLPLTPRSEVWERVSSEADNCLRVRCPHYESCFFYNSRRRAARANLLVVNHSLLMSDLAVRRASGNWSSAAVLPPYNRVILDEAHHLEEVATSNLSIQVTRFGLRQLFGRLYRSERSNKARGSLPSLTDTLDELAKEKLLQEKETLTGQRLHTELIPRLRDVRDSVDFMMQEFSLSFMRAARVPPPRRGETPKVRLTGELRRDQLWRDECEPQIAGIASEIGKFVDLARQIWSEFEDMNEDAQRRLVNPLMEWQAIMGRLDEQRRTLSGFLSNDQETCRWVELSERERGRTLVRMCAAPIDVRQVLRESLHDRMKSEVMTSATLTVDQRFEFFEERCGVPKPRFETEPELDEDGMPIIDVDVPASRPVETLNLDTPFNYREQVFFAVPMDLGDPRSADFEKQLAEVINRAVYISGGRAFILFTSYSQLNRVYRLCEPSIRRLGIEVLKQGQENRDRLLSRFREDETSVLFATSSFWEGVDVKGRALELLIIAKLPFSVPTEPIQEAQFEALKRQGRDPFDALVVPRAVIRLKQGFGRLIRSKTDRGAVLVCDQRVIKQRYGRRFLHSLPDLDVCRGSTEELMFEMEAFFDNQVGRDADTPPSI